MNDLFRVNRVLPQIYHIQDAMDVCCTLVVGSAEALLFDTGYGLFDLPKALRAITDLPLRVLLSHGHYDHTCGAAQFSEAWITKAEVPICTYYTRPEQRAQVLQQAEAKGLLPSNYDKESYLLKGAGNLQILANKEIDLGGISVHVLPMPGHTPGSIGLFVMPLRLMLVGDNWNPTTWVFFPECEPIAKYAETMQNAMRCPFEHVLASHEYSLVPGERLRRYVDGLTPEAFASARRAPVPPYESINTFACHPEPETTLFFDKDKL